MSGRFANIANAARFELRKTIGGLIVNPIFAKQSVARQAEAMRRLIGAELRGEDKVVDELLPSLGEAARRDIMAKYYSRAEVELCGAIEEGMLKALQREHIQLCAAGLLSSVVAVFRLRAQAMLHAQNFARILLQRDPSVREAVEAAYALSLIALGSNPEELDDINEQWERAETFEPVKVPEEARARIIEARRRRCEAVKAFAAEKPEPPVIKGAAAPKLKSIVEGD
jgi:hypothetical protein